MSRVPKPPAQVAAMAAKAEFQQDSAIDIPLENPRRLGTKTFARYEAYKGAKTVREALDRGACMGDLTRDLRKGFISLIDEKRSAVALEGSNPPRYNTRSASAQLMEPEIVKADLSKLRVVPRPFASVCPVLNAAVVAGPQQASSEPDIEASTSGRWFRVQEKPNLDMRLRKGKTYAESDLKKRCKPARQDELDECLRDIRIFTLERGPPSKRCHMGIYQDQGRRSSRRVRPSLPKKGFARQSAAGLLRRILEHTTVRGN